MNDLDQRARALLAGNDRGGFTIPTAGLYPHQWNWDSAFAAWGFSTFDPDRAWREIETLLAAQWPSGMVPHIVFRSDDGGYFPGPGVWRAPNGPLPSSGITQPPVAASVVRLLAGAAPERARGVFGALDAWHRWFHRARDPEGTGTIAVTHPWESGRDNLPDWDGVAPDLDTSTVTPYQRRDTDLVDSGMRPHATDYDRYLALVDFGAERHWDDARIASESPFWVADVATTAILARAERDLAAVARLVGEDPAPIEARAERLTAGLESLWNPGVGAYCSHDRRRDRLAPAATSATFLAPWAGATDHLDRLLDLLATWSEAVTYLVPSFDPTHPAFEPLRYWRGPVWGVVNLLIARGLAEAGAGDWAERVAADTTALIARSGFAEYFDPLTGAPAGGSAFTWTAAVHLALDRDGSLSS